MSPSPQPTTSGAWWALKSPNALVAVVVLATALLLVGGVVLAVVSSRQPEASFPAGSPQAAVAAYLRALQDGKLDDAYAMTAFAESEGAPVTRERFFAAADQWNRQPHRAALLRATVDGDRASVVVEVASFSPDVFGSADRTVQQTFALERRGGDWKITAPLYLAA